MKPGAAAPSVHSCRSIVVLPSLCGCIRVRCSPLLPIPLPLWLGLVRCA